MRAEQTVNEMVQEVLWRQAKVHAKRTGEPLAEALEAVLQTPAGWQLSGLRDRPHAQEEARDWQEGTCRVLRSPGGGARQPEVMSSLSRRPGLLVSGLLFTQVPGMNILRTSPFG